MVEWTQPMDMAVYDTTAKLVAVVQQFNIVGGWIIRPDRHFFGSFVTSLPNEWIHAPDLPSAPTFYAGLHVDFEEEKARVKHPRLESDQSDEDFGGIPMLLSPMSLRSSGLDNSNGSNLDIKSASSTSSAATTTPGSTLITSSVGGGFFGDGPRTGVFLEGSPSCPAPSAPHPPPVKPTAPPFYDDVLRERGPLGTAAGAAGATIPFHPDVAVSRSFSWSPLAPSTARPEDAPEMRSGGKAPPQPERPSPLFSWSPLVSPMALSERAATATSSFRSTLRRFFSLLPPVSPVTAPENDRPAAKPTKDELPASANKARIFALAVSDDNRPAAKPMEGKVAASADEVPVFPVAAPDDNRPAPKPMESQVTASADEVPVFPLTVLDDNRPAVKPMEGQDAASTDEPPASPLTFSDDNRPAARPKGGQVSAAADENILGKIESEPHNRVRELRGGCTRLNVEECKGGMS